MVDIKRKKKDPTSSKVIPLDTLLVNYTKDPDNSNTSEVINVAISEYPAIYPDSVEDIEGLIAYYDHLLNGPKDQIHYLTLAREIYWRGHLDDAIAYLNKGLALLPPSESLLVAELRDIFEIGKTFIGADELLHEYILKLARCDSDILIEGETGTGKDVVARLIHTLSKRNKSPFIAFSVAEIPLDLIESALFGHMKGSFTGAINTQEGLFEKAKDGTIFLDEINELGNNIQVKLLRVFQERHFRRIGSADSIPLKARIIFGTNEPSMDLVRKGRMRKDFFYRIFSPSIQLPLLRGRGYSDFEEIVDFFIAKSKKHYNKEIELTPSGLKRLYAHNWPGNFRELENLIRSVISTTNDKRIEPRHINQHIKNFDEPGNLLTEATSSWWPEDKLVTTYQYIVLEHCQGKIKEASEILHIEESTLRRRLAKSKTPIRR